VSPFELLDASLALDSVPRHGRGHVVLGQPPLHLPRPTCRALA
jgi:hypothetical protein